MKRFLLAAAAAMMLIHPASAQRANYESMVASHAAANGVPAELVHRVIVRESRYNPRAVSKGNYGMMQIKPRDRRAALATPAPRRACSIRTPISLTP